MDEATEPLGPDTDSAWRVLGEVTRLAGPIMLGYASTTFMHFVDTRMVSAVGEAELAAVSSSGVIVLVVTALASGVAGCVSTFAAQSLGRGRPRDCAAYAWQNVYFAAGVGAACAACAPALRLLFAWIGHEPDLQACESAYGMVRLMGMGFMVAAWGLTSYFQGIQRPWIATGASFAANVFNVAANYALIFGKWGFPALGVVGAALGTVAASAFQCALCLALLMRPALARTYGGWDARRFDWLKLKQLLHIGWPASLNFFLDVSAWAIFVNFFIGRFGKAAIAGNSVAMQYTHLSFMPALGLSAAAAALMGKYIGMKQPDRARRRAYMAVRLAVGYMAVMGAVFYAFRYELARWFCPDKPEVVRCAATILVFAAIYQALDALGLVSRGALRGAGDTHWTAAVTVCWCWLFFIPAGYAFSHGLESLGPAGPWIAAAIYISLLGVMLFWRLRSGRWARVDIFRGEAEQSE